LTLLFRWNILLFGVHELPNLINLNPLTLEATKRAVLMIGSGHSHILDEFQDLGLSP
jgi:hypothetical protein